MPQSPPTACPCGGRRIAGVCDRCGPRKENRKSAAERGYGKEWRYGTAPAHLRANPVCVCCEAKGRVTGGRGRAGLRADHIVPVRMAPERLHDPANLQTLCLDCDLHYKQPLENRCTTPEQVATAWAELLERLRTEHALAMTSTVTAGV